MIAFNCPHCGVQLKVNDRAAGKQGQCPGCKRSVLAPLVSTAVAESPEVAAPTPATPPLRRKTMLASPTATPIPTPNVLDTKSSTPDAGRGTDDIKMPPAAAGLPHDYSFLGPALAGDEMGRLGNYRILKALGTGAMGIVFQGEDTHLRRMVAVKAMKPAVAANENNRKRFIREAQLAASIEHDNIVTIYQVGEDRGVPFLAMKLLQGESLEDRLKNSGTLPLADVLRIGREVCEGLAVAHSRSLVHRDIKPANIWLETQGSGSRFRVKIVDFGLARAADEDVRITQTGSVMGTPAYMAPEQANGGNVDGRCDLFSLGGVLYHISTGQLPFKGKDTMSLLMALATQTPEPPIKVNPTLPQAFSDLVVKLLAKDPTKRVPGAREVVDAIEALEKSLASATASAVDLGGTPVAPVSSSAGTSSQVTKAKKEPAAPPKEKVEAAAVNLESLAPSKEEQKAEPPAKKKPKPAAAPKPQEEEEIDSSGVEIDEDAPRRKSKSKSKSRANSKSMHVWILVTGIVTFVLLITLIVFLLTRR